MSLQTGEGIFRHGRYGDEEGQEACEERRDLHGAPNAITVYLDELLLRDLYSGTSSVVVARDFSLPRSRAYWIDPLVLYFSR